MCFRMHPTVWPWWHEKHEFRWENQAIVKKINMCFPRRMHYACGGSGRQRKKNAASSDEKVRLRIDLPSMRLSYLMNKLNWFHARVSAWSLLSRVIFAAAGATDRPNRKWYCEKGAIYCRLLGDGPNVVGQAAAAPLSSRTQLTRISGPSSIICSLIAHC